MPPTPAVSGQTTIIVAACSAAGGLIVVFLTYRLLRYLLRPKSLPLPPIQPLARERELLARSQQANRPTSIHYSVYPSTSLVSLETPEPALIPPVPVHPLLPSPSISSLGADSSENTKFSSTPETPSSISSSALSHSTFTSTQSLRPQSSRYPRPSRPLSTMSTSSTIKSRSNRYSLKGTPHGPHSNVQIVLPMPLAPTLLHAASDSSIGKQMRRHSVYTDSGSHRLSVIDKWTPVPSAEHSLSIPSSSRQRPRSSGSFSNSSRRASNIMDPSTDPALFAPTLSPPVPPIPLKFANIPSSSPPQDDSNLRSQVGHNGNLPRPPTSKSARVLSRKSRSRSRSRPPSANGSAG